MRKPPVIAPFRGIRYNPRKIQDLRRVTAPPYDVISSELQKELYASNPHNVVRLILGEQFETDCEGDNRYTRAAVDWNAWLKSGILIRDPEPSFYLYEQEFDLPGRGRLARRGFLALRRLEEFSGGKIQPHEKTLAGPKADRLLLMKSCGSNFSPIFALFSDSEGEIQRHFARFLIEDPAADLMDADQVRHRLWRVVDEGVFRKVNALLQSKKLFIADGHHRYETAIAYRDWIRSREKAFDEGAACNYAMVYFAEISDPGLVVLPTHRILQNRAGFNAESFKKNLREFFDFISFSERDPFLVGLKRRGEIDSALGLRIAGDPDFYLIVPKKRPEESIDTMILHCRIFGDLLKMSEEEQKDPRYVRFVKSSDEALTACEEPQVNCVFLLKPPSLKVLREVFERGEVLPPKSTYFYPKLLTGLVMNKID